MSRCTHCGQEAQADARFCIECGRAVTPNDTTQDSRELHAVGAVAGSAGKSERRGPLSAPGVEIVTSGPTATSRAFDGKPPERRRAGPAVHVTALVGAVAVVGAAGFFGYQSLGGGLSGGASSPKAAVQELAAAVVAKDPARILSVIAPAQVRGFKDIYMTLQRKSHAVGLVDNSPFAGFDIKVDRLQLSDRELGVDAAEVVARSGSLRYSVQTAGLAPGLRAHLPAHIGSGQVDLARFATERLGVAAPIVTIKQNGGWYVSPADTLLEWLRRSNSLPAGDYSRTPGGASTGASTPREVMSGVAAAVTHKDVSALLNLVSPDEFGAVYRYRQAILTWLDQQGVLSRIDNIGQLTIDDISSEVHRGGGATRVILTSVAGSYSDDSGTGRFSYDDGCLRIVASSDSSTTCLADYLDDRRVPWVANSVRDLAIDVVQVHGRWYLSPIRTVGRVAASLAKAVPSRQLLAVTGNKSLAPTEGQLSTTSTHGTLTSSDDFHVYSINAAAQSIFDVCVYDGNGNPGYPDVVAPDGSTLYGYINSVYRAPDTGTYKVVVDRGEGSFSAASSPIQPTPVGLNQTMQGTAPSDCGADIYSTHLSSGSTYLAAGSGNPTIFDSSFATVHQGSGTFQPPADGTYYVAFTSGVYAAKIIHAAPDTLAQGTQSGNVPLYGSGRVFPLYALAGQRLTIRATGLNGLDTTMTLESANGRRLAFNDDTNDRDPQIIYTFARTGLYRVLVLGYEGATGEFVLAVY